MESKTRRISKFRLVLWVMLLFATLTASAQQVKVTGTVTDPGGEPLVGVSVKAGSTGAITDIDGKYSVEVASSGSISFSYVGFETIMEKVNGRKTINVTLKEKNDVLNEVVVIGYGTMDKKELTSAISHGGEKDFLTSRRAHHQHRCWRPQQPGKHPDPWRVIALGRSWPVGCH